MQKTFRNTIKSAVKTVFPDSDRFRYIAYKPKTWQWQKRYSRTCPKFNTRTEIYDFINRHVIANGAIDYLEFGVFRGESIKYWASINTHNDSRFYGFDSFTGLPEDWHPFPRVLERKTFDTGGEIPRVEDKRVSFVQGLFQETLPAFLQQYERGHQLVIHNDSDLYSSTLYVLTRANDIIVPGTITIFDEFYGVLDEFRALEDYCGAYRRDYELVAETWKHGKIAIKFK